TARTPCYRICVTYAARAAHRRRTVLPRSGRPRPGPRACSSSSQVERWRATPPRFLQKTLSGIRISLPSQSPLTAPNPEVVQSRSRLHDRIRYSLFGVPQYVFHNATALHACERMFDSDSDACQLPVRSLLGGGEFPSGWLFFSPGEFP